MYAIPSFANLAVAGKLNSFPAYNWLRSAPHRYRDHDEMIPVQDLRFVCGASLYPPRLAKIFHGIKRQEVGGPAQRAVLRGADTTTGSDSGPAIGGGPGCNARRCKPNKCGAAA